MSAIPSCKDIARARGAGLAMDYEWMNRQMFYGSYQRVKGCSATPTARPTACRRPKNWPCWSPCAARCPERLRTMVRAAAHRPARARLRDNLRKARDAAAAGRLGSEGRRAAQCQGRALVLEYLDSTETGARTVATPWDRNLEKLGIRPELPPGRLRAVPAAPAEASSSRSRPIAYPGHAHARAGLCGPVRQQGRGPTDSGNTGGIKSPAVDALLQQDGGAQDQGRTAPACRALERVIIARHS
jgi:microcin C transport system substrate-binding protein